MGWFAAYNKAKGILFIELLCNSEILTFISIKIKRNNIDTAPT